VRPPWKINFISPSQFTGAACAGATKVANATATEAATPIVLLTNDITSSFFFP
jgi:hypothetical protein